MSGLIDTTGHWTISSPSRMRSPALSSPLSSRCWRPRNGSAPGEWRRKSGYLGTLSAGHVAFLPLYFGRLSGGSALPGGSGKVRSQQRDVQAGLAICNLLGGWMFAPTERRIWTKAGREYGRVATAFNPRDAMARAYYGFALGMMGNSRPASGNGTCHRSQSEQFVGARQSRLRLGLLRPPRSISPLF